MCGIAGIVGPSPSREAIERMTASLAHRGPDDRGIWRGAGVHLGHTRLSILDLSPAGHQPMSFGPLTITYNGEIYNFPELRRALPGPFQSSSDTEVILHLYRRDGPDAVRSLRGMFAFAIWDDERRRLFAARDRLGIKPFFYRESPGGLAFASELKALVALDRPSLDRESLRDLFTYKYCPAPKTIWSGIRQLLPGHTLTWDGHLRISRYWTPEAETTITDPREGVERLGALLSTIVPEHTLSDVPVGVFLSGGIDSTTVVAHLDRPRTFTLGTDIKRRDESPKARAVARHFGTDHEEEVAGAVDLDEAVETTAAVYDEPFGDSSAWATYLVSRLARKHVKVVLGGDGGDEVFSGYDRYGKCVRPPSNALYRFFARVLPPFWSASRSYQRRGAERLERHAAYVSVFTLRQKRALLAPDLLAGDYDDHWHFREHWREDLDPLKRLLWCDLHTYLPGDLLTKVDRASMAHSLEVRPPLLDHRLVEFGLSVDSNLQRDVETGRGKLLVRRLMEARVPKGLFDLPKRGFNLPIGSWVRKHPSLLAGALGRLARSGVLRSSRCLPFGHEQAWTLLVLDRWMARHGLLQ